MIAILTAVIKEQNMPKIFKYPKAKIIFPYIFLLLIPLVIMLLVLVWDTPKNVDELITFSFLILILLGFMIPITLWMINNLKTEVQLDERGMRYKTLFKDVMIGWNDIVSIDRGYLYEGAYNRYNATPKDLYIKTKTGRPIKIFHIIESNESPTQGIDFIESEIEKHLKTAGLVSPAEMISEKGVRRGALKMFIGGVCLIVFGFSFKYAASKSWGANGGIIGTLTDVLGINGVVALFIFMGLLIIIFSMYQSKMAK